MVKRFLFAGIVMFSALAFTACLDKDSSEDLEDVPAGTAVTGTVTVTDGNGTEHTYTRTVGGTVADYVDLGLPSGTLWATHNIGATNEYDYGAYFAWGEVGAAEEGYTKGLKTSETYGSKDNGYGYYGWENFKYKNEDYAKVNGYSKYLVQSELGPIDNKTTLELCDDAAYVNWGNGWRMPTYDQNEELRNYTTIQFYKAGNTEFNGVAGYKLTSKVEGYTSKYLFFPAAGRYSDDECEDKTKRVYIWSSELNTETDSYSIGMSLYLQPSGTFAWRTLGMSVRPVRTKGASRTTD